MLGISLLVTDFFVGFSREMSMLIGVGVLVYFIFTLSYTKPYVYKCGFFTSSFLILIPGGMLVFFYTENKSELLLLFFLSLFVFNFLVFFIFKRIVDFSEFKDVTKDINNEIRADNLEKQNNISLSTEEQTAQKIFNKRHSGGYLKNSLLGLVLSYITGLICLTIIRLEFYPDYTENRDEMFQMFDAGMLISFFFFFLLITNEGINFYRNVSLSFLEMIQLFSTSFMFGGLSQLFFWGILLFILGNETWENIINYAGPFLSGAMSSGLMLSIIYTILSDKKSAK